MRMASLPSLPRSAVADRPSQATASVGSAQIACSKYWRAASVSRSPRCMLPRAFATK